MKFKPIFLFFFLFLSTWVFSSDENSTIVQDVDAAILEYSPESLLILNTYANEWLVSTTRDRIIKSYYKPSGNEIRDFFTRCIGRVDKARKTPKKMI